MKTKAKLYKKNEFCYSMKRWPLSDESKPLFKEIVLDAIDFEQCLLEGMNPREVNGIWTYSKSALSKFTNKQMIALLDNLKQAVEGKPFFGVSASSDLLLEELLHCVLESHIDHMMDTCEEGDEDLEKIRKAFALNTDRDISEYSDEDIRDWYKEDIWWDKDWLMFEVDSKKYSKKFLQFA